MKFDEIYGIFYDKDNNWFVDEDGAIIYDILTWVTADELYLFKHKKQNMLVPMIDNRNFGVEMYYPNENDILTITTNPDEIEMLKSLGESGLLQQYVRGMVRKNV